jgi:hypothetical protein
MFHAFVILFAMWPGDINGDGRTDLLDYATLQQGEYITGRAVRGDGVTPAVGRPMCVRSTLGELTLREVVVVSGQWRIWCNHGAELDLYGEDVVVRSFDGEIFTVSYVIYVEAAGTTR